MFNNVIIGVDERESRADAIKLALELVAPEGTITLAHVYEPYDALANVKGFESMNELLDDRKRVLEHQVAHASVATLEAATVGSGLHELVMEFDADLLVLGSTHHGAVGRVLIGDDTRDSLNGAPCAVAVAPAGYAQSTKVFNAIGVGYDASDDARHALAVGRSLAAGRDTKISVLEAVPLPIYDYSGYGPPASELLPELLASASAEVAKLDGVDGHAKVGDPSQELTEFSGSVDLLIVGSRSLGPFGRLLHSSTSVSLSRKARCPLLIVPRPQASVQVEAPRSGAVAAAP